MFDFEKLVADIMECQRALTSKGVTFEQLMDDNLIDRALGLMNAGHSGTSAAEIAYQELREGKL